MGVSLVTIAETMETGAGAAQVVSECDTGGTGLRIDRNGAWFHDGMPFPRKDMVCLLASRLRRTPRGGYEVVLPCDPNPLPVVVDDVPFLAVEVFVAGSGMDQVLSFRTNVDQIVSLDAEHLLNLREDPETGEQIPYISLSEGMSARVSRPVYYELVALGETRIVAGKEVVGLWSKQRFFVLGGIV